MSRIIARQPNGLICVFSSVVDCPIAWNLTDEEYINMRIDETRERAAKDLEKLSPFEEIKKAYMPTNMPRKDFKRILKEMEETK